MRARPVAGVFTKSKCASAPVEWCRAKLMVPAAAGACSWSIPGNANAFTGKTGRQSTAADGLDRLRRRLGCKQPMIFLASTGVIGEPLDATKFDGVLATGWPGRSLAAPDGWMGAAKAIMTTDTFPKVATATVAKLDQGVKVTASTASPRAPA